MFKDLVSRIQAELDQLNSVPTCPQAMMVVEHAYDAALEHCVERQILAPLGFTRRQFLDEGLTKLGESLFREVTAEIRAVNLGTELLVFGFDEQKQPHIFSTDFTGRCTLQDAVGFHAIGAGSWAALGWLFTNQRFVYAARLAEIAYRLCEAKFAAETARSVGADTALMVMFGDGGASAMYIHGGPSRTSASVIRDAWDARRNQAIPPTVTAEIDRTLQEASTHGPRLLSLPPSDRKQKANPEPT